MDAPQPVRQNISALCLNGPLRGQVVPFGAFGRGMYWMPDPDDPDTWTEYAVLRLSVKAENTTKCVVAVAVTAKRGKIAARDIADLLLSDAAKEALRRPADT